MNVRRVALRGARLILGALLPALVGAPAVAGAQGLRTYHHAFGTVTLGVSGGFQWWSLDALEGGLADRAEDFGQDGYHLDSGEFGATYGYGAEVQVRLSDQWFLRTQAEWTRLKTDTRDRQFLSTLGGRSRTPVSVGYTTHVESRPMLFSFGLGRSQRFNSVRWGLSANWLLAPVRVRDEFELYMEEVAKSEVVSTGIGNGFETLLSLDYFTDTNMTLYVETYYRRGATVVELDTAGWESTIVPGRRRVDFDGGGIRLGFRWI